MEECGLIEFYNINHPKVGLKSMDPLILVKKVQSAPDRYRLEGANSFRFRLNDDSTDGKLDAIAAMLEELAPDKAPAKAS